MQGKGVDVASVRSLRRGAEVEDPYNLGNVSSRPVMANEMTDHDHREQDEPSSGGFLVAIWRIHQIINDGRGVGETGGEESNDLSSISSL